MGDAQQKAEAVYRTAQREVLGKGYEFQTRPASTKDATFAFGKPSGRSGVGTKDLVCPQDATADDTAAEAVYKKSHGAFGPGEQRTRMIDWSKTHIDPAAVRFGRVAKRPEKNGVGKCLDPGKDDERTEARVVPLRVEAKRQFSTDQVGKARPLGLAPYTRPVPATFGIGSGAGDSWGTAECLRGDFTEEEQLPDADLGKATRPGFRNASIDPSRVFGIPSLRTDVPPRVFSIAEPQNFGQDAPLKDLVNPSRFMTRGIDHSDFARQREREELRSLFDAIGFSHLDDAAFSAIYQRAADHYDVTDPGSVSAQEFKAALSEYLEAIEEDGKPPSWFTDGVSPPWAAAASSE